MDSMLIRAPIAISPDESEALLDEPHKIEAENNLRLVYFGVGLAGKSTNLCQLQKSLSPEEHVEPQRTTVSPPGDRTLFFDYLAIDVQHQNISWRVHVYTASGQVANHNAWLLLLKHVDGIVVVVDSQCERLDANLEYIEILHASLESLGYSPGDVPIVLQYNKRDLDNAASTKELDEVLNPEGRKTVVSTVTAGRGAIATFNTVLSCMNADMIEDAMPAHASPAPMNNL